MLLLPAASGWDGCSWGFLGSGHCCAFFSGTEELCDRQSLIPSFQLTLCLFCFLFFLCLHVYQWSHGEDLGSQGISGGRNSLSTRFAVKQAEATDSQPRDLSQKGAQHLKLNIKQNRLTRWWSAESSFRKVQSAVYSVWRSAIGPHQETAKNVKTAATGLCLLCLWFKFYFLSFSVAKKWLQLCPADN